MKLYVGTHSLNHTRHFKFITIVFLYLMIEIQHVYLSNVPQQ